MRFLIGGGVGRYIVTTMPPHPGPSLSVTLQSVSTFDSPEVTALMTSSASPTQQAAFWLRRDIVRGVLAPNERPSIKALAAAYGLGQSSIREAVLLLSSSGLLVHEHQKGHRVAPVSSRDYEQIREAYGEVYNLALGMAVERGDDDWEERVVVILHRASKVPKVMLDGDPQAREKWQRAYKRLHQEILSGCGSPLLMRIFIDLGDRMERYLNLFADLETDRVRDHHSEHWALVEVLFTRDPARIGPAFEAYFAASRPIRESIAAALARLEHRSS
jgi:GntR family carbon starvation induced transcriptional regulator